MKSTDIKITVRLSLKSRILSKLGVLIFANKIPITVTDNKPDSACKVSAPAKAKMTKPKERTFIKKWGIKFLFSNVCKVQPESKPKKVPTHKVKKKVFKATCVNPIEWSPSTPIVETNNNS